MRPTGRNHYYTVITVLVLFCVFAMVFLLLVSVGGGVYKKTVTRMDESYEIRTTLSYIANKVRYAGTGDVSVLEMDGRDVLAITDEAAGEEYVTYICFYDGTLKELYQKKDKDVKMEYGEDILETGQVDLQLENDLLTISMTTTGGKSESMCLYLAGSEGEDVA